MLSIGAVAALALIAGGIVAFAAAVDESAWHRAGAAAIIVAAVCAMRVNAGASEVLFGFSLWTVAAVIVRFASPAAGLALLVAAACYLAEAIDARAVQIAAQTVSDLATGVAILIAGGGGVGILARGRGGRRGDLGGGRGAVVVGGPLAHAAPDVRRAAPRMAEARRP